MLRHAITLALLASCAFAQDSFSWPEGKRAAVSLTFDDARLSHPDVGAAFFDAYQTKVTFYVVPDRVAERLDGWKRIAQAGHEIANHSLRHPCSGNFPWARDKALENYTLRQMRRELLAANEAIQRLLGVIPVSFAYPCGQTFVGRGANTQSYVPVVADLFGSGRGWLDEATNDPTYADMAQLTGMEMDGKTFTEIRRLVDTAAEQGMWLILAGHEIGPTGRQTTSTAMLEELLPYLENPDNKLWTAPVAEIAGYISAQRK